MWKQLLKTDNCILLLCNCQYMLSYAERQVTAQTHLQLVPYAVDAFNHIRFQMNLTLHSPLYVAHKEVCAWQI